jgi:hypothetical protein
MPLSLPRSRRLQGTLSRHAVYARRLPAGSAENDVLATVALVHAGMPSIVDFFSKVPPARRDDITVAP